MHTAALDGSVQGVVVQITNETDLDILVEKIALSFSKDYSCT